MKKNFKQFMKKTGTILSLVAMLSGGTTMNVWAENGFSAETLILSPADSTYALNLNWYCDSTETGVSKVWFKAQNQEAIEAIAVKAPASEGKLSCKVTVNSLVPGSSYTYQITNDNGATWSKEYQYTVPGYGAFSFAFVGDPQLNNGEQDAKSAMFSSDKTTRQGWSDTLARLSSHDIDFIASAGDQVDTTKDGVETEYDDFTAPSQMQTYPFAAAVGNHDRHSLFQYHYNLPNEIAGNPAIAQATGSTGDRAQVETSGNYFYMVNNALFVVLNDSAYPTSKEQAAPFIDLYEQTLKAATQAHPDYQWLFVQHHKSTQSVAQHVADEDIQYYVEAGFEKLMDSYQVDLVLAGHDHVYVRSYALKNGQRVSGSENNLTNPQGTVYLTCTTGSGLKYYNIFDSEKIYVKDNASYPYLANGLKGSVEYLKGVYPLGTNIAVQNKIPGYTIVKVNGNSVTLSTYATYQQSSDTPIDTFTITK